MNNYMNVLDFTPIFKKMLSDIITMEYSDIKETDWYIQIKKCVDDQNCHFSLSIDNVLYEFSDINDLFKDSLTIYLQCERKNALERNIKKNAECREMVQMIEHAIYKMTQFVHHAEEANDLMDAFQIL